MEDYVYLDHAATTPMDERVLEAMLPYLKGSFGNPSSLHAPGAAAREAVDEARGHVARLIGARAEEIVFTSGGTEADNLAMLGLAGVAASRGGGHALISAVEHAAVREPAKRLETYGYEGTTVGVDGNGLIEVDEFAEALRPGTALAAGMWANNEVGTVQPVAELAGLCLAKGVPFHSDAVQAAGRLPIDVSRVPVSTLALSGHKLYGPQGVGALYVREGVELSPILLGGGQEGGLRSGTENVAGIVGLGEAARLSLEEMEARARHETGLRELLISGATNLSGVYLNGHRVERLSNNVHLSVEGVDAESLVLYLDALGYAVGSGAACSSGSVTHKASPVLLAMGREEQEAFSAVRVTVGKDTTRAEVDSFLEAFSAAVAHLRELSPLYPAKG